MSTFRAICDEGARVGSLGIVYLLEDGVHVHTNFAVEHVPYYLALENGKTHEILSTLSQLRPFKGIPGTNSPS